MDDVKCPVCGRTFCVQAPAEWVYKRRHRSGHEVLYCCSWHCFRQLPEKLNRGRKTGKRDVIFDLMRQGKTNKEIMVAAGVSDKTVSYWRERFTG